METVAGARLASISCRSSESRRSIARRAVRVMSGLFQTAMSRTSSGPIGYSASEAGAGACAASDGAALVDVVVHENIPGEHRQLDGAPHVLSAGPGLDRRQKDGKAAGGQLIVDELLAVAARPQHVPRWVCRRPSRLRPFGSTRPFLKG